MRKYEKAPSDARSDILTALLPHVAFDGWSDTAVRHAAHDLEVPVEFIEMAFPGGAPEMVETYLAEIDSKMLARLKKMKLEKMRVRDRIKTAIITRLEINEAHKETVRRTIGFLALPTNAFLSAKCLWRTVDAMWRAADDTATDYNYYTKRMILGGVYSSTLLVWLADTSDGHKDTKAFLNRRIDNVMEFEKAKGKLKEFTKDLPDPFIILGKMRYPKSHRPRS